jgi:hypothetical protein
MDERKPDLEGTWFQPKYNLQGDFQMFIDKKKKRNNKYLIIGEIKDSLGIATFQGTISRKFIKFIKLYDINAMDNDGAEHLYYKGKWVNDSHSKKDEGLSQRPSVSLFTGVYLFSQIWDPETKKHIDMLIEDYPEQIFEVKISNESLKQDLLNLGKI